MVVKINEDTLRKTSDIMFALGLLMLVACHFITTTIIWFLTSQNAGATAQQVANAFEANPLAVNLVAGFTGISFIISYIVLPGLSLAGYWTFRNSYGKKNPSFLYMMASIVFFSGLLNVTNDLAALTGVLLQYGVI